MQGSAISGTPTIVLGLRANRQLSAHAVRRSDLALHPVYERQAERLTAKARKYGITVPQQPTRYDEDSDDWYLSHVFGFWLPSRELEQRLRREIRDERRASYEEFLKRATLLFV